MCGIAGIIHLDQKETFQAKHIYAMTNKIKHRGPDDEGYILFFKKDYKQFFGDDTFQTNEMFIPSDSYPYDHISNAYEIPSKITFGHRRLSILDLTFAGHQPMNYLKRYWIVYNGEIYNYKEIKQELMQKGYIFRSKTDTEIIMAAYDYWNVNCLEKFNGMWAFVIYDTYKNKIFISRDRFGKKPLYYYKDNKNFIFASEIKAILEHPEIIALPNEAYCKRYIIDGPKEYIKETAFLNIFRFSHASYLEMGIDDLKNSEINEKKFWEYKPNLSNERFDKERAKEYAKKYYELLYDAVKIRLRADVKIGAALSGGMDSSTIVYIINQHLKEQGIIKKMETFSSVYKSSDNVKYCDESKYIDELANHLNVKSNQIEPQLDEIIQEHKKMIYAMENPAVGPNMGGWYTFKLVKQSGVTINLDGQGADEQLGGYFYYLWRHFANLPLSEIIKEYKSFSKVPGVQKIKIWISIILNVIQKIVPKRILDIFFKKVGNKYGVSLIAPVNEMLHKTTMTGLINLIHFGDSQSMAHSIESRLPFMDYRVVEFLASLPSVYKIHNGWTKYIARVAIDGKLPDNITWRKDKMGWPDPTKYWFKGPFKEWLCKEVESSSFLKKIGVGQNIRKRIEGKEDIINLVRLLNLSVWYKIFFSKNDPVNSESPHRKYNFSKVSKNLKLSNTIMKINR